MNHIFFYLEKNYTMLILVNSWGCVQGNVSWLTTVSGVSHQSLFLSFSYLNEYSMLIEWRSSVKAFFTSLVWEVKIIASQPLITSMCIILYHHSSGMKNISFPFTDDKCVGQGVEWIVTFINPRDLALSTGVSASNLGLLSLYHVVSVNKI